MNVHLRALGCRLNEAELERWSNDFLRCGYKVVNDPRQADITVLNSCAVTMEAARKSRQLVRQLHRDNPTSKLVVSGCYASLEPAQAADLLGVDLVVSNSDKERLVELVQQSLDLPATTVAAMQPDANSLWQRQRSRAFIKVQDGCRYRCTFCIVTIARGEERSRAVAEIVKEINQLTGQGVQEVVLTGVHLGGYGSDIDSDLTALISTVLHDTDMPRIRLGSLEPWELSDQFLALFSNSRLLPHLHLPLQSGSDKILRKMARRCRTDDFADLAGQARQCIPDFNLTSDVIVGFPGEDEQSWQATLEYIEQIHFGHLHIFPYSPRPGTKAAGLPEQVDKAVKRQRVQQLHTLAAGMKQQTYQQYQGRTFPVLWERQELIPDSSEVRYLGYTPNYLRVAVRASINSQLSNTVTEVCVGDFDVKQELAIVI